MTRASDLDKARAATGRLERIKNMLIVDLNRMNNAEAVLNKDREILRKTREKHSLYATEASMSENIIRSIDKKQRKTKILADIGFYIFCLALLYLAFKRIPPSIIDSIVALILYVTEVMSNLLY